jgi:hypothetical protein
MRKGWGRRVHKNMSGIFSQTSLETNTASLGAAVAFDVGEDDAKLIAACRELSRIREEINSVESSLEEGNWSGSLLCQHQRVGILVGSMQAQSIEALKLKKEVLSGYLLFDFHAKELRVILASFLADFDRFIPNEDQREVSWHLSAANSTLFVVEDAYDSQETISDLAQKFWPIWYTFRSLSEGIRDEDAKFADDQTKVVEYCGRLEWLLSMMARSSAKTLGELIAKKQVLDFCLSSEVEFRNSLLLTASFLADWERVVP